MKHLPRSSSSQQGGSPGSPLPAGPRQSTGCLGQAGLCTTAHTCRASQLNVAATRWGSWSQGRARGFLSRPPRRWALRGKGSSHHQQVAFHPCRKWSQSVCVCVCVCVCACARAHAFREGRQHRQSREMGLEMERQKEAWYPRPETESEGTGPATDLAGGREIPNGI